MERIRRGLTSIKVLNPTNEGNDLSIVSDRSGHGNLAGRYMHGAEHGWICVATRLRAMPVCAVQNGRAVLTRLEFGAECWPAVAIRHFSEGISAWELQNTWP